MPVDQEPVEFDKDLGLKLLPRLGKGGLGGEERVRLLVMQRLEEGIQLVLDGSLDQIEQEQHQMGKCQLALAGERLFIGYV